jgi:hypothetical protein
MKVILHLGEGKTGTTSIQRYLSVRQSVLCNLGIGYITPDGADNHVCLAARLGIKVRVSGQEVSSLKSQCDILFKNMKSQVDSDKLQAVIISVEHIFMVDPVTTLSYLCQFFDLDSIHVIAYIRDPVSQYVSRMQQRIKASYLIVPPHLYSRDVYSPVSKWVDQIGVDRVHVKPFSRDSLISSDVLVDFLSQLKAITGVDLPAASSVLNPGGSESGRSNSGINVEQMSTVQCFRRIVYRNSNNILQRRSSRMVSFFEDMNEVGQLGTRPRLKPDIAAVILANNSSYIDSLAKLYSEFEAVRNGLAGGEELSLTGRSVRNNEYISIVDLFVDRSASILNLYRFLCLPLSADSKSPASYLQMLFSLLGRCDCTSEVSEFITRHVEKVVAIAVDKGLSRVQVF